MTPSKFTYHALIVMFVGSITYVLVLLGMGITRAAEPIQFVNGEPPSSLSVGQVIAEASLNGAKYNACKGDIYRLFQGELDKKLLKVGKELVRDALAKFKEQAAAYATCWVAYKLNHTCVKISAIAGVETCGLASVQPDCVRPIASEVTSYLKLNWKDKLKSNFLASCTSLYALKFTTDTIDDIIRSQGPGGAPAYATDWINAPYVKSDEQGFFRFWAILVNTDICPYMKNDVYEYFNVPQSYIDNPPNIGADGLKVNADDPFFLTGACTLSPDFDPAVFINPAVWNANDGYALLNVINERQNNFAGFIGMASAELRKQRAVAIDSTVNMYVSGGGFSAAFEPDSCLKGPNGECMTNGNQLLPPKAVGDQRQGSIDAEFNKMVQTNGEDYIGMTDLGARLQSRLLGVMNNPMPLILEIAPEHNADNFTPEPTPTPSVDPNDPACTGGNPQCTCVTGNPDLQQFSTALIAPAMAQAMRDNPSLFVAGTNQVTPGANRQVLQAICNQIDTSSCVPNPASDFEIVFRGYGELSMAYDVITRDGFVRINGGEVIRQCEGGVQD